MSQILATPVVDAVFPDGTVDDSWHFVLTGTNADGTPFTGGTVAASPSAPFDLPPGTFTLVVSKNGMSSLASAPFTVAAPVTVTLSVPDSAQPATITAA